VRGGGQTTKDITKIIGVSSQGGKNHGTIYGPKWVKESRHGKARNYCLKFDKDVHGLVNCGNDPSLDITDKITIEAWIKPAGTSTTYNQYIIAKRDASSIVNYLFYLDNTNIFKFSFNDGSWHSGSSDTVVPADVWSHVAVTYDKQNIKLYLNGESVLNKPETASLGQNDIYVSIGGDMNGGSRFNGLIDEVAIYNRALSAKEIRDHYRMSKQ